MGSYTQVKFKARDVGRPRTDLGFQQGADITSSGSAPQASGITVTDDVTVLATAQTTSTFTMTPTRVDTATAGSATGAINADATDATMAANIQTAIRALGGIYANATCTAGTTDTFIITVFGGYDVTWATTATSPTVTESGSAGGVTAVPGSVRYRGSIPVRGNLAEVKRIQIKGFADNSLDVSVKDAGGRTIFAATGIDTWTSPNDVQYLRLLTADGVAGEDGAAAANSSGGVFDAPFVVDVTTSAPITFSTGIKAQSGVNRDDAFVGLVIKTAYSTPGKRFLRRSSGALTALSGTFNLGEEYVNIKRIKLQASSDTSVAPTLTDADGLVVYTKTSTDYTTAVVAQLSHEGVDQANNAVADTLDVIARSPLTVSGSGLGAGTFTIETICEV